MALPRSRNRGRGFARWRLEARMRGGGASVGVSVGIVGAPFY